MFHIFLRSQNKTAAALHLGTGDCCEEKHSNAAELLLKEGELWWGEIKKKNVIVAALMTANYSLFIQQRSQSVKPIWQSITGLIKWN